MQWKVKEIFQLNKQEIQLRDKQELATTKKVGDQNQDPDLLSVKTIVN